MLRKILPWVLIALGCLDASTFAAKKGLSDTYRKVKSSVVVIETRQKEINPATQVGLVNVGGLGSGVLISDDGKVATAAHVVQTADEVMVHFISGEKIRARVAGSEPGSDVALLQLERLPADGYVAPIGDSDKVEVGDKVFVIGAPLGITHSLTVGHISARRMDDNFTTGFYSTEVFQTDAAINQGNSGGPMFNMKGEVIGIVSYIISQSGGFEGIGFVITSKMFTQLLLNDRALWSGVQGKVIAGDLAKIFQVPTGQGLLVEVVADRSLGTHLGLEGGIARARIADQDYIVGGDIIVEVMGISLADQGSREEIRKRFDALKAGDEINVKVLRVGKIVELKNYFFPDVLLPSAPKE